MKTVIATFDQVMDAESVVEELERRGVTREHIGVIAREATVRDHFNTKTNDDDYLGDGVSLGVATGAGMGGVVGLLAGLGVLAIPGIGPLYAVGTLAGVVTSLVAGGALGALGGGAVGSMVDWGLPREHAEYYSARVQEGAVLLAVEIDESGVTEIEHLFADFGGGNIHTVDERTAAVM